MRNTFILIAVLSIFLVVGLGVIIYTGSSIDDKEDADTVATTTVATTTPSQTVRLYYYRPQDDINDRGELRCSEAGLTAITQDISGEGAELIHDTLEQLLESELPQRYRLQGLTSEFPLEDVRLVGLRVDDGVATVAIDDQNGQLAVDNCRSEILRLQIEQTIRQFPTVSVVRFLPTTLFQSS